MPVRVGPVLASKANVARPLPLPREDACSQEALAVAVHGPATSTMSESLPAAGPSTNAPVPRAPVCDTVRVWPAMVSVPTRVGPVLASKVNVARPSPLPLEEVCSQEALAVEVHGPAKSMASEPLPPAALSTRVMAAKIPAWVTVI